MDDVLRQCLYDPAIAHDLVLARRPAAPTPVRCVVSDVVWSEVIQLLRWAAADTRGSADLQAGIWWRLAARCADLLRRFPGLSAELDEPWEMTPPPEDAGASGAERVRVAAARLARLLTAQQPVPLQALATEVDALGAAALGALVDASSPVQA